jgi:hypothetical protein
MTTARRSARLDRRHVVARYRQLHIKMAGKAWLFLALAWPAFCASCARESASSVHGKVTLDGEPVAAGNISFLPTAGSGRKAAAAIEQGVYALAPSDKLPAGTYRVEIRWPKPTGRKISSADPGTQADETREAVPAKYNSESKLTVEIRSGDLEKDFALSSK